jgi:salicylate hydroxylase
LQVTPNGAAVLAGLGLSGAAEAAGLRAAALEPADAVTGRSLGRFDLSRLPGQPYRFFHRAALAGLLAEAARAAGVVLRTGARVAGGDAAGGLRLASGEVLRPDLAVGADGLHSVLRPVLNGPDSPFFTGQAAWRALIPGEGPPVVRLWLAPGRHVVSYPLPGGRINIVAVRAQAVWAPEGWHHDDDPAALRSAFADLCPELRALLDRVTATRLWGLFRHPVARRWHGPGLALLGDAAHPTLPFLAQGANLALEDAWVLAAECARRPDLPAALAAYEAARRPRVTRAIAAANANARLYHLAGLPRQAALAALRLTGALAPRLFLRRYDWLYGADVTRG